MTRNFSVFVALLAIAGFTVSPSALRAGPQQVGVPAQVAVCFTPDSRCESVILGEIQNAKQTIEILAYSFTSKPIRTALLDATRRGVKVRVVIDHERVTEKHSIANDLAVAGIPVYSDSTVKIAHNKVMIFDGATLITGSYNFTASAEHSNAENLLVIHDSPQLVRAYHDYFERRRAVSRNIME